MALPGCSPPHARAIRLRCCAPRPGLGARESSVLRDAEGAGHWRAGHPKKQVAESVASPRALLWPMPSIRGVPSCLIPLFSPRRCLLPAALLQALAAPLPRAFRPGRLPSALRSRSGPEIRVQAAAKKQQPSLIWAKSILDS